jgi:hypothetical protein
LSLLLARSSSADAQRRRSVSELLLAIDAVVRDC